MRSPSFTFSSFLENLQALCRESAWALIDRWEWRAGLGRPVVPEVKMTRAPEEGSSAEAKGEEEEEEEEREEA